MYKFKVWQYKVEEGKPWQESSIEWTDYLTIPIFIEDRLDETLDTGEIILDGMPIATKKAFPPKLKFRIERYDGNAEKPSKTWDMVVEHDDVEEYVGCQEICCHRINLIEASVIAQGMHVDNIALTYELQDVDLNYRTTKSSLAKVTVSVSPPQGHQTAIRVSEEFTYSMLGGGGNT